MNIQIKEVDNPTYTLNLELSKREMEVLAVIFGKISGVPEGPRGVIRDICRELDKVGMTCATSNRIYNLCASLKTSEISFPNSWEEFLKDGQK